MSTTSSDFWSVLETIRGQAAVAAVWRNRLGDRFEVFRAAFLQRQAAPARFYPCPVQCGCAHEIICHPDGSIVGVCRCDPWNCEDLALVEEDIVVWELSRTRLARALAKGLGLNVQTGGFSLPTTFPLGSWSVGAVPVMLTLPLGSCTLRQVIGELATRLQKPFILLAPTHTHLDAVCTELLAHAKAGFFDLASHLVLTDQGMLQPQTAPGLLFARFTPEPAEPLAEDVARQAFALLERLDSKSPPKPPTVLTVFRLYCMKEMNAEQIARKCRCSKSTVIDRLKLIRTATGLRPEELRRVSMHLGKIEADLADARAEHIRPRRLIYDDEAQEE